ncbi:MAG: twin-arginine translocase TatA/TatE family subunit [Candidatus Dormibacteria bacterium]
MPFVSGGHLWLILILLVIVLIVWGPGKLPDVGAGMGRAIREFKKASTETREHFTNATGGGDATPAGGGSQGAPVSAVAAPAPHQAATSAEETPVHPAAVSEDHRVSS